MSSKADKPNPKEMGSSGVGAFSSELQPATNWPEQNEPPIKSKAKSIKLKKNAKTENTKKLIRQSSKDSVVLTGYKNLKVPHGEPAGKYKDGDPKCDQKEELKEDMSADPSSRLGSVSKDIHQNDTTTTHTLDCLMNDLQASTGIQRDNFTNLLSLQAQARHQAGTGAGHAAENKAAHGVEPTVPPAGLRHIEVKPSDKNPYQGDKVTILFPCPSDPAPKRDIPEITQTDCCEPKPQSWGNQGGTTDVGPVGGCAMALRNENVPSASSRLSDSGIESEPSSATQLVLGPQALTTLTGVDLDWLPSQAEQTPQSAAPKPPQLSPASKASPVPEVPNPESTSGVSGVQSSLTSINSLPSDDEVEGEAGGRKSSVIVQEQTLVFSGGADIRLPFCTTIPTRPSPHRAASTSHEDDSVFHKDGASDLSLCEAPALSKAADPGPPAGGGAGPEASSDVQTAAQSSTSATSSTDLVKKGLVENYFGSRSSTDISEISPVETAAITLGIQTGPQATEEEVEEEEQEHEMIENGYYEETDGPVYVNGLPEEEGRSGELEGTAGAEARTLLYEHLGLEQLRESYAPRTCQQTRSSELVLTTNNLCWYESAPSAQMKA